MTLNLCHVFFCYKTLVRRLHLFYMTVFPSVFFSFCIYVSIYYRFSIATAIAMAVKLPICGWLLLLLIPIVVPGVALPML